MPGSKDKGREDAMHSQDAVIHRCSFCNKDQNDVRRLIAGPTALICDECVEVCNEIIAGKYDRPSSSDEYVATAWPLNGPETIKCRTCGHMWPSHESDTNKARK
jgi:hypothetical protein